jgi:hypothetical protein
MKYIQELKTGMRYFFKPKDGNMASYKEVIDKYLADTDQKRKEVDYSSKENLDIWFNKQTKNRIFNDLEDQTYPGFL